MPIFGSVQDQDLIFISVAARMLGMHPQTLRKYERLGLVQPTRTIGSMRLYSHDEIERIKLIKRLVDEAGINLAGVQRLLSSAEIVQRLRPLMRDESRSLRTCCLCSCRGSPSTMMASTIALSALSRPSRAIRRPMVTKSDGANIEEGNLLPAYYC